MKVFVGLSGGVDSATSAALLKEQGHDVTGVFIKIWQPEFIECTWREDRLDAMRVAVHLNIPFKEIDLSDTYKETVIADMIDSYRRGVTPNPDVLCNREIKFGAFAKWAYESGADAIATGHYVRKTTQDGGSQLLRGVDSAKDQSYFLHQIGQAELTRSLFPIGEYPKAKVRELAQGYNLPVAQKHDSQGLCFVGDVSMHDFLARFIDIKFGPVTDASARVIGEHDGAALYTLGQRHGFRITDPNLASVVHYCVAVNTDTNTIIASPRKKDAETGSATVTNMHWIGNMPISGSSVYAQTRYREPAALATVAHDGTACHIQFAESHLSSPGQSLVLYLHADPAVCLGGGTIIGAA